MEECTDMEHLNLHALAEERLMLGLRTRNGVNLQQMKDIYGYYLSKSQLKYLSTQADDNLLKNKE